MSMTSSPQWITYPPTKPTFNENDHVFIRSKSKKDTGRRGRVVVVDNDLIVNNHESNNNKNNINRVSVKIQKTTKLANHKTIKNHDHDLDKKDDYYIATFRPVNLIPIIDTSKQQNIVLLVETTNQYRKLAASQLIPNDHVLEIGCSNGECSLVIDKYLQRGIFTGFDISQEMIGQAKVKFQQGEGRGRGGGTTSTTLGNNHVEFHTVDPFTDPKQCIKLATRTIKQIDDDKNDITTTEMVDVKPSVIFIDIGGNRDFDSVVRMIAWCRDVFSPRLFIIKSEEMWSSIHKNNKEEEEDNNNNDRSSNQNDGSQAKRMKVDKVEISIESDSGIIINGEDWFQNAIREIRDKSTSTNNQGESSTATNKSLVPRFSHPLKAPLALSPADGKTPICRFHNYDKNGCKKKESCPFDHEFCHWCLQPGHIASMCQRAATKQCRTVK